MNTAPRAQDTTPSKPDIYAQLGISKLEADDIQETWQHEPTSAILEREMRRDAEIYAEKWLERDRT